jgi:hypothetical protein
LKEKKQIRTSTLVATLETISVTGTASMLRMGSLLKNIITLEWLIAIYVLVRLRNTMWIPVGVK